MAEYIKTDVLCKNKEDLKTVKTYVKNMGFSCKSVDIGRGVLVVILHPIDISRDTVLWHLEGYGVERI